MPMKSIPTNTGLVRTIILIVIALIILSYFGFNLREIVNSPTGKGNFTFTQEIMINIWNDYLKDPAIYLWHIFKDLIWDPAIDSLTQMKNGESTIIDESGPRIAAPQAIP